MFFGSAGKEKRLLQQWRDPTRLMKSIHDALKLIGARNLVLVGDVKMTNVFVSNRCHRFVARVSYDPNFFLLFKRRINLTGTAKWEFYSGK